MLPFVCQRMNDLCVVGNQHQITDVPKITRQRVHVSLEGLVLIYLSIYTYISSSSTKQHMGSGA